MHIHIYYTGYKSKSMKYFAQIIIVFVKIHDMLIKIFIFILYLCNYVRMYNSIYYVLVHPTEFTVTYFFIIIVSEFRRKLENASAVGIASNYLKIYHKKIKRQFYCLDFYKLKRYSWMEGQISFNMYLCSHREFLYFLMTCKSNV